MVRFRPDLEKDLDRAGRLLSELPSWVFGEEERQELEALLQKIRVELAELSEQCLIVGILGGTGVGKSTVMNALAGQEISKVSHRRPYTDRVIVYHHLNVHLPEGFPPGDVPSLMFSHEAAGAEKLILCDLPDFDSIKEEHRQRVLSFLKSLDILVWVTSPEKYADQAFYDFLREAIRYKNPENYYFVLNKIDLITSGSHRAVESALKTFEKHLVDNGISRPVIFAISALEALERKELGAWNQWEIFRREILRERELKEIREIKKANIHQELSCLLERVEVGKKQLERVGEVVDEMIGLVDGLCEENRERCTRAITQWLSLCVAPELKQNAERNPDLSGPARLIQGILSLINRSAGMEYMDGCDDEALAGLGPVFKRMENRMTAVAVSKSIPPSVISEFKTVWNEKNLAEMFHQLLNSWKESAVKIDSLMKGSFFFRCYQRLVYVGLFALFVASVGKVWEVQATDLLSRITAVFLNFCAGMFSIDGLGAILVFMIFELFAGVYFFSRYRKSLQSRVEKFIEALSKESTTLCNEFFLTFKKAMEDKKGEILSGVKEIRYDF